MLTGKQATKMNKLKCYDMGMARYVKLPSNKKFLHKSHSGKLRAQKHTSYGALLAVLLMALLPLVMVYPQVSADEGSYQTYAVVPAPVPTTSPQITNIPDGRVYNSNAPLNVSGSCPANTLVKIFKNETMAGATLCNRNSFQLQIDLFEGANTLIARAYNANDIAAPDSRPISVTLDVAGFNSSDIPGASNSPASQFYMTGDIFYRGAAVDETMSWPLTIAGGQPPYAISIGWGDGKTDLLSQGSPGKLTISHTYTQAASEGGYKIFINATDQSGDKSYLQLVAIVGGDQAGVPGSGSTGGTSGLKGLLSVRTAIQSIATLSLIMLSFWLGEKRELHIASHKAGGVV